MANPSELKVVITGDAGSAMEALSQFSTAVKGTTSGIESQFKALGRIVDNFKAPFLALTAALGGKAFLKSTISETVDWTVEAQKLARVLGITTEEASALGVAVKGVHGDAETFLGIAARMIRTLNTNEDAFHKLGIATRDSQGHLRGTEDVMLDTFAALSRMKEGTDRNVASAQIFGRSWLEVWKYLSLNKTAIEEARAEAQRLNLIVGSDSVAAVNAFRKSDEALELTLKGLKIRMGQELIPTMTAFNQSVSEDGPDAIAILGVSLKGLMEILDGAWSGFKMFSVGLVGTIRAIYETLKTVMSTTWGFLSAGIPGAKKAWEDGNKEMGEDWEQTLDAMEEKSKAYMARQDARWGHTDKPTAAPAVPSGDGHADTKSHAEKTNSFQEEMNRLKQEDLKTTQTTVLAEKERAEMLEAGVALEEARVRIAKEQKEGRLTGGQAQALRIEAEKVYADQVLAIDRKFGEERASLEAKLQEEVAALGQKGLAARYAATAKHFEDLRKLNAQLVQDGKPAMSPAAIDGAETRARAEDFKEQTKADQEDLKRKLAEATQIEGPLTRNRQSEILDQFGSEKGETGQAAVKAIKLEMHWDGTAAQGALRGLQDFSAQTDNIFKQLENFSRNFAEGLSTGLGKAFADSITKGGSFGARMTAMWQGLRNSSIQALSDIAAKQAVGWATDKATSAWKAADAARHIALEHAKVAAKTAAAAESKTLDTATTASTVSSDATQTAVSEQTMAAKIYAWYASMGPWAIPAAAATIAAVIAAISGLGKVTAHAVGGVIDKPTLALMGEAGTELVAPEKDFQSWAAQLSGAHMNLGYNLAAHDAQVGRLHAEASQYAAQGLAQNDGRVPAEAHVHLHGGVYAGSLDGRRAVQSMVQTALKDIGGYTG